MTTARRPAPLNQQVLGPSVGPVGHWDVIVLGASPAGAACAAAARRADPAARVLVLDRADFPREKICGDGIAPEALDVLAGLASPPPR